MCHDMGMISPWLTVIAVLATARITRLITRDSITQPIRTAAVNRVGIDSRIAELIQCDWCTGMWASAAVMGAAWAWGEHWWVQVPLLILAAAHVVGWLATREGE
jgi:Protein of unknown function (DUF1360)